MRTGTLATFFLMILFLVINPVYSIPVPENSETVNENEPENSRQGATRSRRIAQAVERPQTRTQAANAAQTQPPRQNPQTAAPVQRRVTRAAAQARPNNVKSIRSVVGENFIITLKRKNLDGEWEIANYDKKIIELVENRRSVRNTYFIFKPMKKGVATIKLVFKTSRAAIEAETYQVNVMSQADFQQSISRSEDNQDRAGRRPQREQEGTERPAANNETVSLNQPGTAPEGETPRTDNSNPENPEESQMTEETQFQLIKDLFERKAYGQAVTEAEDFMKKFQNSGQLVDVIVMAGKAYNALNQYPRATELFKKYLEKVKNINITYPVYFAMARSLEKAGKKAEAQIAYIRMFTLFKDKPALLAKAHLLLGKSYLSQNNLTLGVRELERLVTRFPDQGDISAEAYYHLGRHYYKTRGIEDYEKSYRSFKKLITMFPESRFADPARRMVRYLRMNYIEYR